MSYGDNSPSYTVTETGPANRVKEPRVLVKIEELFKLTEVLEHRVQELSARLARVSTPSEPEQTEKTPPPHESCPMADQLQELVRRIDKTNLAIDYITSHIEV